MTTNKKDTQVNSAVAKSAIQPTLNKHDEAASIAAKTKTKNDGSHIVKQRQALIDSAKADKETK
jgi:hypothetical protein